MLIEFKIKLVKFLNDYFVKENIVELVIWEKIICSFKKKVIKF